jgi:hypothetical protein
MDKRRAYLRSSNEFGQELREDSGCGFSSFVEEDSKPSDYAQSLTTITIRQPDTAIFVFHD